MSKGVCNKHPLHAIPFLVVPIAKGGRCSVGCPHQPDTVLMSEMPGLSNDEENENVPADDTASEETSPEASAETSTGASEGAETPTPVEAEADATSEATPTPEAEAEATPETTPTPEPEAEAEAVASAAADADASDEEEAAESSEDAAEAEDEASDDDDGSDEPGTVQGTRQRSGYERGELIEVTVREVSPTRVEVDLDERGEGFTGIIPKREMERMGKDLLDMLVVGEQITLYVVNTGDPEGNVVLSLNRALEKLDWQQAEAYRENRTIYEGVIAGYNKGGLIVRFGRLRGFVPQSQISDERRARLAGDEPESTWSDMVKEEIQVKVIEVDRERNRLILSERAAARETREERKAALIEELQLNEVRTGRVVSLEDFGAFVDIGGAEGLVHLTELSWGHVTHPKQVLTIGDEITVEVINIDQKRKRIGLSLKRQLPDPWDVVASNYREGELVRATITKLTKFGAFAQLEDHEEVEGLVHISELSEERVAHPRDVVQVGETLTLRIVKMDVADRRLGLSLKAVSSTEYMDDDMNMLYD